jgi:hypothetical protein
MLRIRKALVLISRLEPALTHESHIALVRQSTLTASHRPKNPCPYRRRLRIGASSTGSGRLWLTIITSLQLRCARRGRGSIGPRSIFPRDRACHKDRLQDMNWSSPHHMLIPKRRYGKLSSPRAFAFNSRERSPKEFV